jgi:hypothetical protein
MQAVAWRLIEVPAESFFDANLRGWMRIKAARAIMAGTDFRGF